MFDDYITVNHACKRPTIERVYGVGNIGIEVKSKSWVNFVSYNRVYPVPLTEEILNKNGFVQPFKDDSSIYCEAKEDVDWFYRINIHYDVQEGFFIDAYITNKKHLHSEKDFSGLIKYVHELQHIFRMLNIEKEVII